mgnify:CR=1 FL=1
MRAICSQCGGAKARALGRCRSCEHRPQGNERPVAWLLSSDYLNEHELDLAAERIVAGEPVDPTLEQLELAREALNPVPEARVTPDRGLSPEQQVLFLVGNLLLSPLIGVVAWVSWRRTRPESARQLVWLTVPVAAVFGFAWLGMMALAH